MLCHMAEEGLNVRILKRGVCPVIAEYNLKVLSSFSEEEVLGD